jgi:hypothetical protein
VSAKAAVSGSFLAPLIPVGASQPLTVAKFIPGQKPGNVAVCLSGGGSRALSAGMGQLNGLQTLQYATNQSLLSQAKALSTVSGGSWLGVPFVYLPPSVADVNYLGGPYVQPAALTPTSLGVLPSGCAGANITSDFTLVDMAVQAVLLYWEGVPANMLWQTIIGLQLLTPYGLFASTGWSQTPSSFFSYNQTTLNAILAANPALKPEEADLVSAQPRPYLVCNTAMFVTAGGQSLLAPVQATSFMSGIVSTPPGAIDANGFKAGGGGVTSFAFNSSPTAFNSSTSTATVAQQRQWALVDIVGSSSAAFAATLQQTIQSFSEHPEQLAQALMERGPAAVKFLRRSGVPLEAATVALGAALTARFSGDLSRISKAAFELKDLIPSYQYWPVANPPVGSTIKTTDFADGGSLENLGIADVLSYGDIANVIAFINTSTPISQDAFGVIVVDDSIPPLFGYQPYVPGTGYTLYQGASNPSNPLFQKSQIFPSAQFQTLLNNLWSASGSGSYQNPPIYSQALTTVQNTWFGVAPNQNVTVLWVYLERVKVWYDQLSPAVQSILGPFDNMLNSFPHYSTLFATQLSPTEINLLANLTAWIVINAQSQFQAPFHS